jgi:hypothetical protein
MFFAAFCGKKHPPIFDKIGGFHEKHQKNRKNPRFFIISLKTPSKLRFEGVLRDKNPKRTPKMTPGGSQHGSRKVEADLAQGFSLFLGPGPPRK